MFTNYILIYLNGQPFNCSSGMSLRHLLAYLNFDLSSVVVEYNSEIISIDSLSEVIINSGDKVEVLTMVGGG